ncbi:hypothetical protein ACWU4D_15350 [Vibrio sp. WJH972]
MGNPLALVILDKFIFISGVCAMKTGKLVLAIMIGFLVGAFVSNAIASSPTLWSLLIGTLSGYVTFFAVKKITQ